MNNIQTPAEEKKEIQRAYRNLLKSIRVPLLEGEAKQIREAYELALEAHEPQRRKSGAPYILHPIEVARICAEEIGLGGSAIVAALLHDVVEDSKNHSLKDITDRFGTTVALIVDGVTKVEKRLEKDMEDEEEEDFQNFSPQAENFRKILLTMSKDVRVILIKLADRLHNMRTIEHMSKEKRLKIAAETTYVYAPLAHRLGLYSIKTELEDLALKVSRTEEYENISKQLKDSEKERNNYIKKFIAPVKARLLEAGYDVDVVGRVKSINSIANKVKKKQMTVEEIYDVFAIRVILNNVLYENERQACWGVFSHITEIYTPVPERLKDWVSVPKSNGYESLHTTVMGPGGKFVEVQIRTKRMDEVAEKGFAAHYKYKGVSEDKLFERFLNRVRELVENTGSNQKEKFDSFHIEALGDEVYVFTPKGEIRYFVKGATALDFAFDIHTKVGEQCRSVKVNGSIAPISYVLQNGDQLEVITNSQQKPHEGWLKLVKTGRAQSKIRQALREEFKRQGEIGKETLERKLKNLKLDFEDNCETLVKHFGFANRLELYFAIYMEKVNLNEIKTLPSENGKINTGKPKTATGAESKVEQPIVQNINGHTPRQFKGRALLFIDGEDAHTLPYAFSTCCNPVQGDDIFAYISAKSGIKIHRSNCTNAQNLFATYAYRIKKAEWVDSLEAAFDVRVKMTGVDDMGIVKSVTDVVAGRLRLNMKEIYMKGDNGYFEGYITVVINNRDQLELLIETLKSIRGMEIVTREGGS